MNYIGSKKKLLHYLNEEIIKRTGDNKTFFEPFAGTGVVSQFFKNNGYKVYANDMHYYSYIMLYALIQINDLPENTQSIINHLNNLDGIEGFIFENYAKDRLYFSKDNAKKIDAIRTEIDKLNLTKDLKIYMIASLVESADKVANVASVYGSYLKNLKRSATNPIQLKGINLSHSTQNHVVTMDKAENIIDSVEGGILYLDPPYNARQYGANYHLLDTIALYDNPVIKGISGIRANYEKSVFCSKLSAKENLANLIQKSKSEHVFLSYNNEGLIRPEFIEQLFKDTFRYYDIISKSNHQRFKSNHNKQKNNYVTEYLYYGRV